MRIAHTTGRTDDFGINDRFVVIQCPIGISVRTYRIAYGFLADVVTCKIGKEISYVIFFGYIVLFGNNLYIGASVLSGRAVIRLRKFQLHEFCVKFIKKIHGNDGYCKYFVTFALDYENMN